MSIPAYSGERRHSCRRRIAFHKMLTSCGTQAVPCVLILFFLLLTVSPAFCTATADSTESFAWSQPSWGHLVKVVLLLVLVIVLIWVCLGLLKRAMGMRGGGNNGVIMAGGVPLGQRKSIQFIKIGGTLYLIGVTDHNIGLIDTIKDENEIEDIVNIRTPSSNQLFSTLLKKVSSKLSNQNAV